MKDAYDHEPETGQYLKIANGEKARVRLMGRPFMFTDTYKEDGQPPRQSKQWAWPVLLKWQAKDGTKNYEAKTFKAGSTVYTQIRQLLNDEDWGDPSGMTGDGTGYDLEIERQGEKLQTKWFVTPKPRDVKTDPKPEHLALFEAHGYDPMDPDWADNWLEKSYVKQDDDDAA